MSSTPPGSVSGPDQTGTTASAASMTPERPARGSSHGPRDDPGLGPLREGHREHHHRRPDSRELARGNTVRMPTGAAPRRRADRPLPGSLVSHTRRGSTTRQRQYQLGVGLKNCSTPKSRRREAPRRCDQHAPGLRDQRSEDHRLDPQQPRGAADTAGSPCRRRSNRIVTVCRKWMPPGWMSWMSRCMTSPDISRSAMFA